MAMDVELRNSLGALTVQVSELVKQSQKMDGTLNTALERGAKGADRMRDRVRQTGHELNLVETVATRMGRTMASQAFTLAASYVGVNAVFNQITGRIEAAMQRAENRAKGLREFVDKSRPAAPSTLLPEQRKAIRAGAPALEPDEQADALRAYLDEGGPGSEAEVKRLGQVVNASHLLGFDVKNLATRYSKLRKQGVRNPEDVIYRMAKDGKLDELDKMKSGAARTMAQNNLGLWNRAVVDSRIQTPADYDAWRARTQKAANEGKEIDKREQELMQRERRRVLTERAGDFSSGLLPGPFGIRTGIKGLQQIQRAFPGMSNAQIESAVDQQIRTQGVDIQRAMPWLPQPVSNLTEPGHEGEVSVAPATPQPAARPPGPWWKNVPQAQSPTVPQRRVAEVRIVGDARPVPINAGE